MYLAELTLTNLRSFESTRLELLHPDAEAASGLPYANVTLLLGNNGSGKTTVLRALALGALTRVLPSTGFVPDYLIRRGEDRAGIGLTALLHEGETESGVAAPTEVALDLEIHSAGSYEEFRGEAGSPGAWQRLNDDAFAGFFLVGYGAGRRVETGEFDPGSAQKRRHLRYQRVASLFEDQVALTPLAPWLPNLQREDRGRFEQIVALFNRLMPPEIRLTGEERPGRSEMMFRYQGTQVPYFALSDGYRAYAGWIGDLLYHLHGSGAAQSDRPLDDTPGVVLLDEIDLHLHPNWQRSVIEMVAGGLPRLQFVLTTHSPIVTATLQHENIVSMEAGSGGASSAERFQEEVHGKTAEQVLLSSYFGLDSTRAPSKERQLRQIAERAWKGDQAAAREYLEKLAE